MAVTRTPRAAVREVYRQGQWTPALNTVNPPSLLTPGHAAACLNVDVYGGTVKRRDGWLPTLSAAIGNSISTMSRAMVTGTNYLIIGTSTGALYYWLPVRSTNTSPIAATLISATSANPNRFLTVGKTLYCVGTSLTLAKWDGTSFSATIAGSIGDPDNLVFFNNAIWTLDNSVHPNSFGRIRWSGLQGTSGVEVWPANNFLTLWTTQSLAAINQDSITGMAVLNNSLIVLTDQHAFRITGQPPDDAALAPGSLVVTPLLNIPGCVAANTVDVSNGRLIWLSAKGLFMFDGVKITELTEAVRPWFLSLTTTLATNGALHLPVGRWITADQYMLSGQFWTDSSYHQLVLNFNPFSIQEYTIANITAMAPGLNPHKVNDGEYPKYFIGNTAGMVGSVGGNISEGWGSNSDNGSAISWT